MMPKVTIAGVPAYNGEYQFDMSGGFTGHELHLIKQVAGLRLAEIDDALEMADYDLVICVAVAALYRNGKVDRKNLRAAADLLLDAPAGDITFEADDEADEGDDASPPAVLPTEPKPTGDEDANSLPSSETSSSTGDDPPAMTLVSTGTPASATG